MLQQLDENMAFEQGTDPSVLLILFSGFPDPFVPQPYHLIQSTSSYQYSKVFVRDPSRRLCLHGIGGNLDSLDKLLEALRDIVARQKISKIITVGSSGGSFPAILFAHLLRADYCHAFTPFTYANVERIIQRMDWSILKFRRTFLKLNFLPTRTRRYYDLRKVLMDTNGHTKYFLHVCRHYRPGYERAKYLVGIQNVRFLSYPCNQHVVLRYFVRTKSMDKLFDVNMQDKLHELEVVRSAIDDV